MSVLFRRAAALLSCLTAVFFLGAPTLSTGSGPAFAADLRHTSPAAEKVDDEPALRLRFGDHSIRSSVMTVSVMPGESIPLTVANASELSVRVGPGGGEAVPGLGGQWLFRAPDAPGTTTVMVRSPGRDAAIRLQVFVLQPWDHRGTSIDGYRIGRYQPRARRGLTSYERPRGFVRVTERNRDLRVSPNFRLSQFLCKQGGPGPEFALIDTELIQALEAVLAALRERGHSAPTLHVMSGFRTPFYNRSIGNTTVYSRHLYGDAADIFVDADNNGWMDDLTGDGRVTEADARYLARVIQSTLGEDGTFEGGLGTYGPASHRGPFVHLDFRGYPARW